MINLGSFNEQTLKRCPNDLKGWQAQSLLPT